MNRAYRGVILIDFLLLLALWQGLSLAVASPIFPSPIQVGEKLIEVFLPLLAIHAGWSLWRIACGLCLAVFIGFPLGVAMGYSARVNRLLSPLVYVAYPVPKIALLPIVMLACGVGETAKILLIFLILLFQIVVALRDAVRTIPAETFYPLYSLGAPFSFVFREILWPASLPKFLTALRVAMATAISVLFFAETFGTQYGMGYFIMDAWLRVNYLEMYAGIVVLSLMGLFLFGFLDVIERILCRWQKG
ncbi:MAG: ABC transporter permease [Schwartzia sp. (in: firmicutes)]